MTWRVDLLVDAKDDVSGKLKEATAAQFTGARAHQRRNFPAIALQTKRKPEDVEKDMKAFWDKEDAQVARAVKAAAAMREGHVGASFQVRVEGHCNADGSGVVTASVVTVRK